MRITVTIKIDFDKATIVDPEQLREGIKDRVNNAIGNGLLTGDDVEAIIDDYKTEVQ